MLLNWLENGADIIEIGLPFSDPLADGPMIQKTSRIALKSGVNTDIMFKEVAGLKETGIPLVVMSYFNPIYRYGVGRFLEECVKTGIKGLIIPDLPLEEAYSYRDLFNDYGLDNIMMVSLTTSRKRMALISRIATGFVYCVSVRGVTGAKAGLPDELKSFLKQVKSEFRIPAALGFGLSSVEQINQIKGFADGIIIGSKILSIIDQEPELDQGLDRVAEFCRSVRKSLDDY
ncbi:MAG: tryptophan synthase subunit alpha [Actinomycetota bacterium]|nr:tryptophan synthase subunit alpha [Actinomycetota bacterium]